MPVDANLLVALMAPRPLILQTGDQDFWSDPKGEFLAAYDAWPRLQVTRQRKKVSTPTNPSAGTPIFHTLSYYMHAGGHGTIPSDWDIHLKFLGMNL
jgi:hypothetical protein